MELGEKILLTFVITLLGGVIYGLVRDEFGTGHYIIRGAEILLLVFIWTRPGKKKGRP
jgi:hypothetical protein